MTARSGVRKKPLKRGGPRIFTREVLAAIPMWVEMGARPKDIAAALGTTVPSLAARCSQLRISLAAVRPAISGGFPPEVWSALQRAADQRSKSVPRLISDIVASVAERNLFSEVLDDRGAQRSGGGESARGAGGV